MNLNTLSGRAKWCGWCWLALVCCAPTLSFSDHLPSNDRDHRFDDGVLRLAGRYGPRSATPQRTASPLPPSSFAQGKEKPVGDTRFLVVNGGFLGIFNRFPETLRYGAEFRWRELGAFKLRPSAGVVNAENDASYYHLGLRRDFSLNNRLFLTGSFDAGYFEERDEIKLGLQMEFRSGAEISYRFAQDYRVGLALYHLSNGGFGERNPGTESIVLSLISPVR